MVQATVFDLRNVHQTVTFAEEVHESTEVDEFDNFAFVDFAFFWLCNDRVDHIVGFLDRFAVGGCDFDDAFVVDVDFCARHFNDFTDDLTARTDHFTDLVGRDLHGFDARSVNRELVCRGQSFAHFTEDVQTTLTGLLKCFLHDGRSDALNFDVHLQRGDTSFGTRYFEVHVAEVVFVAEDVGQNCVGTVVFENEAHCNASNRCFERNASVHHRQGATTDRSHGGRTVRFSDLGHNADGVWEVGRCRQNCLKRTPCQFTVTDFTTTRRTNAANFTNRVRREVIVQQEVRTEVAVQSVDDLFVVAGAEGGNNQTLGFAASEQSRTVRTWQQASFTNDRANLIQCTTVDALTFFNNRTTENRGFELFQRGAEVAVFELFFGQGRFDCFFCSSNSSNAFLFVGDRVGSAHLLFASCFHNFVEVRVVRRSELERLFCGFFCQINDQVDNRLDLLVSKVHSAEHFCFGQLVSFGFNHHHSVFGACNNQIEALLGVGAQVLHVVNFGVEDVFTINETNAATSDRAHERRARDGQCSRSSDHRNDIGIVDEVVAQHGAHQQNFVFEARNEQRADRTVDQARSQCFFFGRARFALKETARNFTGGIVFLLVVNRQGEEVLTGFLFLSKGHVCHNRGFAKGGNHGAVSLTGNLAGFQSERFFAPLDGFFHFIEHQRILIGSTPAPAGLPFAWWPHCHRPLHPNSSAGV